MNVRQIATACAGTVTRLWSLVFRATPLTDQGHAPQREAVPLGVFGCLSGVNLDRHRR